MKSSVVRKDWLAFEGHIQPLNGNGGLHKLREEKNDHSWFIIQDSNIFCYDQKGGEIPPNTEPVRMIDITQSQLEVFVVISSGDGKDYQLTPPKDIAFFDWLMNLKESAKFASNSPSPSTFERGANGGGFMGKLRHSFRRKKKIGKTLSEEPRVSNSSIPNSDVTSTGTGSHLKNTAAQQQQHPKRDRPRSKSFPWEQPVEPRLTDTLPPFSELTDDLWTENPQAEGLQCSWEENSFDGRKDERVEKALVEDHKKRGDEEEKAEVRRVTSIAVQTNDITQEEILSLQQQKLTKELETEICKLKCEVISLIQGSIKIPLKDDDLADWQLVEDIRYKDRIHELLRDARLFNPSLPDFDSSASCSFKDSYGFIRGTRESESELFHFVCRELKQHYASFYRNKKGHDLLWKQYVQAKQQDKKNVFFKEREMKALLREGIPATIRREVWKSAMALKVEHIRKEKGKDYYQRLVAQVENRKTTTSSKLNVFENQIKCDLLRTMPNNERFRNPDSDGIEKLWRILSAFCLHRPDMNYLQGMNFIVAMCLLFMDEEDSFWSLVAVTEVFMKNYFDESLSGAQADQYVLNELLSEMLPALHAHLKYYGVDMSTVTFNWLLTIFIDAVPFETAVRIWDCFLFEGREALFRIAVGLLKLQQRALLRLSCPLDIMQYMKRAARVMYDKDQLFKCSYDELKGFPTTEVLDEKQAKYLAEVKTRNDDKLLIRDERTRSRVGSFTVEIPHQEKLDKPDQQEILECALATSRDLSTPVCLFSSSRFTAKVYLLDINNKELKTVDVDMKSRVLCTDLLEDGTILVGTVSWYMHAFLQDLSEEVWCIQLSDSVIDIAHLPGGKLFAALADGSIAVLQNASGQEAPSEGSHIRVGGAPVTCLTLVEEHVWCGCGNSVVILDGSSHVEMGSHVVSTSRRHQVSKLEHGKHGVWCTVRGSSCLLLLDQVTFKVLLKIDDVTSLDATSVPKVIAFHESRVTTVMAVGQELWVGLGNGQVLIFDVINNDAYEAEAYVVLKEQEDEDRRTRENYTEQQIQNEAGECNISRRATHSHHTPIQKDVTAAEDRTFNSSCTQDINQDNRGTLEAPYPVENNTRDKISFKETRKSDTQQPSNDLKSEASQGRGTSSVYHNDFRFRLRLRVHYRINEEAIRCLLLLRDEDPVILSCAGSFNEEAALSLWRRQKEEDTDEWLPLPIKHRFTETGPISFRTPQSLYS